MLTHAQPEHTRNNLQLCHAPATRRTTGIHPGTSLTTASPLLPGVLRVLSRQNVTSTGAPEIIVVPMTAFTSSYSTFTGDCTDHGAVCCTDQHPEVCPSTKTKSSITGVSERVVTESAGGVAMAVSAPSACVLPHALPPPPKRRSVCGHVRCHIIRLTAATPVCYLCPRCGIYEAWSETSKLSCTLGMLGTLT